MNANLPDAADDRNALRRSPVLKVQNLSVYQGNHLAVQDVSFELSPGTDTAVVGPNGAGKSTLIQAILGLIPSQSDSVEILGRPLQHLNLLRSRIGYIPQNFVFDRGFPLSVRELVGLGWFNGRSRFWSPWPWQSHPAKTVAVAHALARVDADYLRHQPIGTLSLGELKRVLLAYCLVTPRRLLVLDEAAAGIDVQGEADFYTLLHELKSEQGWTILQVSHDLDMVSRHCDHVLCLNQRLICHGQPAVALSSQNLLAAYGPAVSRYQHHH
ncbi:MAG TPA: metal ABC transporter ATP-binding protein [Candidatus Caenarcaniphilales bacterium]